MIRSLSILIFVLVTGSLFAQKKERLYQKFDFVLRSKALEGVIFEDVYPRSHSFGFETIFLERFSVCADIVNFRWKRDVEVYESFSSDDYEEFAEFDSRNYLAIELRHYPSALSWNIIQVYYNALTKIGRRHIELDDGYPMYDGMVVRSNSDFYDLGLSVGGKFGGYIGVDVNFGVALRNETRSEDIFNENGPISYPGKIQTLTWLPNMRLNFFCSISRSKNFRKNNSEKL